MKKWLLAFFLIVTFILVAVEARGEEAVYYRPFAKDFILNDDMTHAFVEADGKLLTVGGSTRPVSLSIYARTHFRVTYRYMTFRVNGYVLQVSYNLYDNEIKVFMGNEDPVLATSLDELGSEYGYYDSLFWKHIGLELSKPIRVIDDDGFYRERLVLSFQGERLQLDFMRARNLRIYNAAVPDADFADNGYGGGGHIDHELARVYIRTLLVDIHVGNLSIGLEENVYVDDMEQRIYLSWLERLNQS